MRAHPPTGVEAGALARGKGQQGSHSISFHQTVSMVLLPSHSAESTHHWYGSLGRSDHDQTMAFAAQTAAPSSAKRGSQPWRG